MLLHSITTQTKDLSNLYSSAGYLLKAVLMVSLKNKVYAGFWIDCMFFFKPILQSPTVLLQGTHISYFS